MTELLKYVVFVFLVLISSADGQTNTLGVCTGTTPCYCKFDNGQYLDLSSLGNRDGTPRFLNVSDTHEMTYSYNPCFAFTEGPCRNVSACAIRPAFPSNIFYALGYHNTAEFMTDTGTGKVTIKYTTKGDNVSPIKSSYVNLVCDRSDKTVHTLTALGPPTETSLDYYFDLHGILACPQGSASTTPSPAGLTGAEKGGIATASVAIVACGVVITLIILKRKGKICQPKYDAIE